MSYLGANYLFIDTFLRAGHVSSLYTHLDNHANYIEPMISHESSKRKATMKGSECHIDRCISGYYPSNLVEFPYEDVQ